MTESDLFIVIAGMIIIFILVIASFIIDIRE